MSDIEDDERTRVIESCETSACYQQILAGITTLRREMNTRISNLEAEINQIHRRFEDTPAGVELSKWAASQAGTAVVGMAEVRAEMQKGFIKIRSNNRLAIAVVSAISVIITAAITAITGNWPSIREAQVHNIAQKEWDNYRKELEAREMATCERCRLANTQARGFTVTPKDSTE